MRRTQEWSPGRPYKKNRRDVPGFRVGIPGNLGSRAILVSGERFTRDSKTAEMVSCGSTWGLWPFDRCTGVNPGSSGNGVSGRASRFHTSLWQRTHWRPAPCSGLILKLVATRLHSFPQLAVLPRPFHRPHPQQVQYVLQRASAAHERTQQCVLHLVEGFRHRLLWCALTENLPLMEGDQLPPRRATGETWNAIEASSTIHCQPKFSGL